MYQSPAVDVLSVLMKKAYQRRIRLGKEIAWGRLVLTLPSVVTLKKTCSTLFCEGLPFIWIKGGQRGLLEQSLTFDHEQFSKFSSVTPFVYLGSLIAQYSFLAITF